MLDLYSSRLLTALPAFPALIWAIALVPYLEYFPCA
jgi:hypothetical protein